MLRSFSLVSQALRNLALMPLPSLLEEDTTQSICLGATLHHTRTLMQAFQVTLSRQSTLPSTEWAHRRAVLHHHGRHQPSPPERDLQRPTRTRPAKVRGRTSLPRRGYSGPLTVHPHLPQMEVLCTLCIRMVRCIPTAHHLFLRLSLQLLCHPLRHLPQTLKRPQARRLAILQILL